MATKPKKQSRPHRERDEALMRFRQAKRGTMKYEQALDELALRHLKLLLSIYDRAVLAKQAARTA